MEASERTDATRAQTQSAEGGARGVAGWKGVYRVRSANISREKSSLRWETVSNVMVDNCQETAKRFGPPHADLTSPSRGGETWNLLAPSSEPLDANVELPLNHPWTSLCSAGQRLQSMQSKPCARVIDVSSPLCRINQGATATQHQSYCRRCVLSDQVELLSTL
jgi:hypothetical protein